MFKFFACVTTIFTLFSSFGLYAASGYISDDVYVFIHTGPSNKYKILGSVKAGTPIEILKLSNDGNYQQIVDDKKRTGWIKSEFLSTTPSLRVTNERLQQRLDEINKQSDTTSDNLIQATQKINQLERALQDSNTKLIQAQESERNALSKLKGEDERIKMQWAKNGGMLVGISILFGVALTFLPKKKKKKGGNWS